MRRYLIVANQTLGGSHLLQRVQECLAKGPCSFTLVVPASPSQGHLTWTEEEARAGANRQLTEALRRFRALGADMDGWVGDFSPMRAIEDALHASRYDEIILSTLPPGISRWLRLDLPHRVRRNFGVPMTHLIAELEPA
jgi:hypothetical protein